MPMKRQPLGDHTVHIAYDLMVANGGEVFEDTADYSGGRSFDGGRGGWALTGFGDQQTWRGGVADFPDSPSIGELQVHPILPEPDLSALYPDNRGETNWKGNRGREGHFGFPRDHGRFPDEGIIAED